MQGAIQVTDMCGLLEVLFVVETLAGHSDTSQVIHEDKDS